MKKILIILLILIFQGCTNDNILIDNNQVVIIQKRLITNDAVNTDKCKYEYTIQNKHKTLVRGNDIDNIITINIYSNKEFEVGDKLTITKE